MFARFENNSNIVEKYSKLYLLFKIWVIPDGLAQVDWLLHLLLVIELIFVVLVHVAVQDVDIASLAPETERNTISDVDLEVKADLRVFLGAPFFEEIHHDRCYSLFS